MKNENEELFLLYDFYHKLLTENQEQIFECYYKFDIGLTEIAEQFNITKQAVKDSLEKAKKNLYKYEQCLNLVEKYNAYLNLKSNKNNFEKEDYIKKLESLIEE